MNERPILIDFGIGSLASAPCLTGSPLPPGTEEYRAPEQIRFQRANPDGTAQYEYGPADELWALGVGFYWLLTDVLPFGERTDEGGLDGLRERILTQRPIAPHIINPRVPLAVSLLCMKMLAERPEDRFPDVSSLCAGLSEALAEAENDATWDVPLVDPFDPQTTTTVEDPAKREPNESRRTFLRLAKRRPRRGQLAPNRAPVLFLPGQMAAPRPDAAAAEQDRIPAVEALGVAEPAGEHEPPVPSALVPPDRARVDPPVAPHPRRAAWRLGLAGAVLAVAIVALSVGANLGGPGSSSRTSEAQPELPLPFTSPAPGSTDAGVRGREVALPPKPLESLPGGDAAPVGAKLPASTANAMLRKNDSRLKPEEKPTPEPQRAGLLSPLKNTAAVGIACALLDGGCTGGTAQVRPEPPAVVCPDGWKEAHATLRIGGRGAVVLQGYKGEPGERATVHDGPVTVQVLAFGLGRARGTLLSGTLQLGENRFFGTFTQAQIPGGKTYSVCVQIFADTTYGMGEGPDCPRGVGFCPLPGSKSGAFRVPSVWPVYPTGEF